MPARPLSTADPPLSPPRGRLSKAEATGPFDGPSLSRAEATLSRTGASLPGRERTSWLRTPVREEAACSRLKASSSRAKASSSRARPTMVRQSDASTRQTAARLDITVALVRQEASLSHDGAAAFDERDTLRRHVVAPSREEAALARQRAAFTRQRATSSRQRSTLTDYEASTRDQSEAFGDEGDTATRLVIPQRSRKGRQRIGELGIPDERTHVRQPSSEIVHELALLGRKVATA